MLKVEKYDRPDWLEGYYVYVYLDTRKEKGVYKYGEYQFDYEPFYVGKGIGNRFSHHLRYLKSNENKYRPNAFKNNTIKKILEENKAPDILILEYNLNEDEALELENKVTKAIGLRIDRTGPLTNIIHGGTKNPILYGELNGFFGKKHTQETIKRISIKRIKWFRNLDQASKNKFNKKRGDGVHLYYQELSPEERKRKAEAINLKKHPGIIEKKILNKKIKQEKQNKTYQLKIDRAWAEEQKKFMYRYNREEWLNQNRIGKNNPNYGNGDKIKNENNGRAKIYKVQIKYYTFVIHGRFQKFRKEFKKYFKCSDPVRCEGFRTKYGYQCSEITSEDIKLLDNYIEYKGIESFEALRHEVFTKCKIR